MEQLKNYWKTSTGKIVIIVSSIIFFCCICGALILVIPSTPQTPELPAANVQETANAMAFTAIAQTQISAATSTPSETPAPTQTKIPTATNTPQPQPITLTGSGDAVVDLAKWEGPAIMRIKYGSGGNLIITNYNPNNERIDLLVNTIGAYEGTVPIDFMNNENTVRFEVKASGPWEFTILPISSARAFDMPATVTGAGSDVIILRGDNLDLIKADNSQGDGNFIVFSYSDSQGRELIFNEIAPYAGTALLPHDTVIITISATGNWSLEITTK